MICSEAIFAAMCEKAICKATLGTAKYIKVQRKQVRNQSMDNFKEFVDSAFIGSKKGSERKALPSSKASLAEAQNEILLSVTSLLDHVAEPEDKKEKFSKEVSSLVSSDDFIEKLSDRIGIPKDEESEDAFVERSKSELRKILFHQFGLK